MSLTAASVIARVAGNVNLPGNVNGMTMGRVFNNADELIIDVGNNNSLFERSGKDEFITLPNRSKGILCNYWFVLQAQEVQTKGGAARVNPGHKPTMIDNTNNNN